MKLRVLLPLLLLTAAAVILTPLLRHPGNADAKRASRMAATLYIWMASYANDREGRFPEDLRDLITAKVGFPEAESKEWLDPVIEYRGRGLTTADDPRLVVLRYRIANAPDKEVRVTVSGSGGTVPVTEPLPQAQGPRTN